MSDGFAQLPKFSDLEIIRDLISQNGLEVERYASLILMVSKAEPHMAIIQEKLKARFSDDIDGLYHDYESLLMARDYLATLAAQAKAQYEAAKKRFLPKSGTGVDKEAAKDSDTAPYRFYADTLAERIKSLDNRCTAAKQQQKIIEEAIKRNLIVP